MYFHGQANRNYHEVAKWFIEYFSVGPVSPSYVGSVVMKNIGTFRVTDAARSGHAYIKTEEIQTQVLGTIGVQSKQSGHAKAVNVEMPRENE